MKKAKIFLVLMALTTLPSFAQMSGTYEIGQGNDFDNLTDALSELGTNGASGPVIFLLTEDYDYVYEIFPLNIYPYPGLSLTNNLTIKPAPNTDVQILGATASASDNLIYVNCPYVIIDGSNNSTNTKNLEISNTSPLMCSVIQLVSNNIQIKNLRIHGYVSDVRNYGIYAFSSHDCLIYNNLIYDVNVGIIFHGSDNYYAGYNELHSLMEEGIEVWQCESGMLRNNYIHDINNEGNTLSCFGIKFQASDGNVYVFNNRIDSVISENTITTSCGMSFVSCGMSALNIINNSISNIASGQGSEAVYMPSGIRLVSPSMTAGISLYYNTITLNENTQFGLNSGSGLCFSTGIFTTASNITAKNNIINNRLGERDGVNVVSQAFAIYSPNTSNPFLSSDYNLFYADANVDTSVLIQVNDIMMDLNDWNANSSMDANSYFSNPLLDEDNYPQPCSEAILNGGFVESVTYDINDSLRDTNFPTIGAYEYQVEQAHDVALLPPVKGWGYLTWLSGNTCKYAVFMKEGDVLPETPQPVNGTTYSANEQFGMGDEIGTSGWYCVYNGDFINEGIWISNILDEYSIMVCGYFGGEGSEHYITETNATNPVIGYGGESIAELNVSRTIYPNPAKDFIIVNTSDKENLVIYDMLGNKRMEIPFAEQNHKINIQFLPSGLYILQYGNKKFQTFVKE